MNTRHKHYNMIVAWAEGKEVQWKPAGIDGAYDEWADVPSTSVFDEYNVFRIKPEQEKTVGFKRYIRKDGDGYFMCSFCEGDTCPERFSDFHKWVDSEWQYYTITGEG